MKLRNLVSVVSAGILGCVSSFGFTTPANADLNICSQAGSQAFVAISFKDRDGIIWSKGWVVLEPGQCKRALSGSVRNVEIAITGQTYQGTIETGSLLRCVIWQQSSRDWTVKNADKAEICNQGKQRGMGGFNVFKTDNSRDYTYTVYD